MWIFTQFSHLEYNSQECFCFSETNSSICNQTRSWNIREKTNLFLPLYIITKWVLLPSPVNHCIYTNDREIRPSLKDVSGFPDERHPTRNVRTTVLTVTRDSPTSQLTSTTDWRLWTRFLCVIVEGTGEVEVPIIGAWSPV